MNADIIYLDNNASTQCAPEVLSAMMPFLRESYGNAASPHVMGRYAASAVANARGQIADSIQSDASEVFFTSGATEANNLVLLGLARHDRSRKKIVTTPIEHKSVLEPLSWLEKQGFTVVYLPVNTAGLVDLTSAKAVIDDNTLLVSVQAANNEVGALQPIAELTSIAHNHGAAMHCDAAQLLGKVPFTIEELGADFFSFSAHKAYGPKGIGFLVARRSPYRNQLMPLFFGGGQEGGLRPGSLNIPGIVGAGEACRVCRERVHDEQLLICNLRNTLESYIQSKLPSVVFAGSSGLRLPGTSTMLVPGIPADLLISRLPQLCMSIGSACSSGTLAPSHVLSAMGYSRGDARTAVRISLGRYNTKEEIDRAAVLIVKAVADIYDELPDSIRH